MCIELIFGLAEKGEFLVPKKISKIPKLSSTNKNWID